MKRLMQLKFILSHKSIQNKTFKVLFAFLLICCATVFEFVSSNYSRSYAAQVDAVSLKLTSQLYLIRPNTTKTVGSVYVNQCSIVDFPGDLSVCGSVFIKECLDQNPPSICGSILKQCAYPNDPLVCNLAFDGCLPLQRQNYKYYIGEISPRESLSITAFPNGKCSGHRNLQQEYVNPNGDTVILIRNIDSKK